MRVFWGKGFEATSLTDLTDAMGINRPSLYAAYGNKQELFRKALERYLDGPSSHFLRSLEAPTARLVAEVYLGGVVSLLCDPDCPGGCLWIRAAITLGDSAPEMKAEIIRQRAEGEALMQQRFERAQAEGDLSRTHEAGALARLLLSIGFGMGLQAACGAGRAELEKTRDLALTIWPK